ncbi:MAG: hypothetical protein MJ252_23495 [archaeon]|nr:hypothetical protein [archaeon]
MSALPKDLFRSYVGFYNTVLKGNLTQRDYLLRSELAANEYSKEILCFYTGDNSAYKLTMYNIDFILKAIFKDQEPLNEEEKRKFFNSLVTQIFQSKEDLKEPFGDPTGKRILEMDEDDNAYNKKTPYVRMINVVDYYYDSNYFGIFIEYMESSYLLDYITELRDNFFLRNENMEPVLGIIFKELLKFATEIHDRQLGLFTLYDPNEIYVIKDAECDNPTIKLRIKNPTLVYFMTLIKFYCSPEEFPWFLYPTFYKVFDNNPPKPILPEEKKEEEEEKKEGEENLPDQDEKEIPEENKPTLIETLRKELDINVVKQAMYNIHTRKTNPKDNFGEFIPSIDYWSIGCLIYFLIFNKRPFEINNFESARRILDEVIRIGMSETELCSITPQMQYVLLKLITVDNEANNEGFIYEDLKSQIKDDFYNNYVDIMKTIDEQLAKLKNKV